MILAIKGLQSRFKWKDAFCRQEGVQHALDHMCDSLNSVVVGIYWSCGWWTHSSPAGHRHHRGTNPSYSGTKVMVAIWTRKPHRKEKNGGVSGRCQSKPPEGSYTFSKGFVLMRV
jgi:hypothetical protein